jgi:hypothetical protein
MELNGTNTTMQREAEAIRKRLLDKLKKKEMPAPDR